MNKRTVLIGGAIAALVGLGGYALAQTIFPLYTSLTGNEIIQDVGNPTSAFFKTNLLSSFINGQAGTGQGNALIGGDFATNLFQRGTSTTNITTGPTFTADRWFAWSGTSTNLTVAQDTTSGDFPATTNAALKVSRTGTGIVQSCVGQDVTTGNSLRFAGNTAEFDFHAVAGAGFSAVASQAEGYIVYGTGTDEGAQKLAYTINTGGGGGSGWTNGTIATNAPLITLAAAPASGSNVPRYTVQANIPATIAGSAVTEVGVAVCWTPTNTTPSNDYMALSLMQLVVNDQLPATPSSGYYVNTNNARPFTRKLQSQEVNDQLAYFWQQNETATPSAGSATYYASCRGTGSTTGVCLFQFPTQMRAVPTLSYTAGTIVASIGTSNATEAVSAATIATHGATVNNANISITSSSVATGVVGFLQAGASTGGGVIAFSAEP